MKQFSTIPFLRHLAVDNAGTEMVKRIVLALTFSVVYLIQC